MLLKVTMKRLYKGIEYDLGLDFEQANELDVIVHELGPSIAIVEKTIDEWLKIVPKPLSLWCVDCDALMHKQEYDDRHDRYKCPGCERLIEVEKHAPPSD